MPCGVVRPAGVGRRRERGRPCSGAGGGSGGGGSTRMQCACGVAHAAPLWCGAPVVRRPCGAAPLWCGTRVVCRRLPRADGERSHFGIDGEWVASRW